MMPASYLMLISTQSYTDNTKNSGSGIIIVNLFPVIVLSLTLFTLGKAIICCGTVVP